MQGIYVKFYCILCQTLQVVSGFVAI